MTLTTIMNKLDQLIVLNTKLYSLSELKIEAIKDGKIEKIEKIMIEEQKYIKAINQVENERQQVVGQYIDSQAMVNEKQVNLLTIISSANNSEKEKLELQREKLISITEKLKASNELNQQLIYQSLQYVNLSLDMLRPQEATFNYDGKPANASQMPAGKRSMFDSKA